MPRFRLGPSDRPRVCIQFEHSEIIDTDTEDFFTPWHTILGVETGLDALLSPTHLLLFIGMAAILTTPVRAAWLDPRPRRGWRPS